MNKMLFLSLILLTSCASVKLKMKDNVRVETLGIYLESDRDVVPEIKAGFSSQIDNFIHVYNRSGVHKFKLKRTLDPNQSALTIRLVATQFVTPGQQVGGTVISLIGLSLPFIMVASGSEFYFFFYYFPTVKSQLVLSLSPDISGLGQTGIARIYSSPGFLKKLDGQQKTHILKFEIFLKQLVRQLERSAPK